MLSPVCTLTCATRIPSSVTIAFSPPASTVPDAITVCSIFPDDGADAVTCGTVMDAATRDAIVKTSMTASKPASPFNQKIPDFPVTAISFSKFLFFLIFFIFSITFCSCTIPSLPPSQFPAPDSPVLPEKQTSLAGSSPVMHRVKILRSGS